MKGRKIFVLLLCIAVAFVVVGCGEKIPEGFTEDEYEKCQKVIDAIDGYLDAEIAGEDAVEKLDVLSGQLEISDNYKVAHIGNQASHASRYINRIVLGFYNTDKADLQKIKDARDEIIKTLKEE